MAGRSDQLCVLRGVLERLHTRTGGSTSPTLPGQRIRASKLSKTNFILISDKEIQDTYSYLLLYSIKSNTIILAE